MRSIAVLLLAVLAFTVLAPAMSFAFPVVQDGSPFLGNLDVCHSAAPALASNGEMPCDSPAPCTAAPLLSVSFSEPVQPVFTELILTNNSEHPPMT